MSNPLQDKAIRFAMLKAMKEHHEHMSKVIGAELNTVGAELFKVFVKGDTPTKSIRLDGSRLFKDGQDRIVKPELKYHPTIVDIPAFYKFLREGNEGAIIKETIHSKTLETWTKNRKEKNQPLPPLTMLKVFTQESAKVTRAPKGAGSPEAAQERQEEEEGEASNE